MTSHAPRAALAKEANASGAGQYNGYGQAASAQHPVASVVTVRRSPASPGVSRKGLGT